MVKVLFVCLGNICRSPMGKAILTHKVVSRGLEKQFQIDSCGTSNYHIGDNADPRTIATVKRNGIEFDHCVRQLTAGDLDKHDFIFVMDRSNLQNTLRLATTPAQKEKIILMRDYDKGAMGADVPDPYYGTDKNFQEVYDILDHCLDKFLAQLLNHKTT